MLSGMCWEICMQYSFYKYGTICVFKALKVKKGIMKMIIYTLDICAHQMSSCYIYCNNIHISNDLLF